jgi:ABC-type sugar transport system ATPase subunit
MAAIRLTGVEKTYPGGHAAVRGVDLEIGDGELCVLVGPSGCGKSTLLRIVAGLEAPTGGRVFLGGVDVTERPPQARDLAMVFQSYALYPHKTVRENLGFGLRMRKTDRREIARRVEEVAVRLGIEALLERRPAQLSGGQRQRVAVGRAIVRRPCAFLFDEPLSNLDARMRAQARAELARLHQELGATMLYVTHDQEEAMTLGTRIAVMKEGRFEQVAPPLEVYDRPATVFVAGLVGSPAMNLWSAADPVGAELAGLAAPAEVIAGIRPQDVLLEPVATAPERGRVQVVEALGGTVLVHVALPGGPTLRVLAPPRPAPRVGDAAGVRLALERLHFFDAVRGGRTTPMGM